MALKIKQLPLPRSPRRSSTRQRKIAFTVSHHSTVIGNGNGLANSALRDIWRTREASAHYGVDGAQVAQLLSRSVAAWSTADFIGNHAGVSIEHANSSGPPSWRLSALTLLTGAQLVAEIHVAEGLGRPVRDRTMKRHSNFSATACPGPFFGHGWANYCYQAQQHYDRIINGTDTTEDDMTPAESRMLKDIHSTLSVNGAGKGKPGTILRLVREITENSRVFLRTLSPGGRLSNAIEDGAEFEIKAAIAELSDADVARIAQATADEQAKRLGRKS